MAEAVRDKLVDVVARDAQGALAAGEKRHAAYRALPTSEPLFPTDDVGDDWAPDAADPFAKKADRPPPRPPGAAGLLAAIQQKKR